MEPALPNSVIRLHMARFLPPLQLTTCSLSGLTVVVATQRIQGEEPWFQQVASLLRYCPAWDHHGGMEPSMGAWNPAWLGFLAFSSCLHRAIMWSPQADGTQGDCELLPPHSPKWR